MPVSKVELCNAALSKLGQDVRITSLSENTKAARALNVAFDRVLDFVLADGIWPFALKYGALAVKAQATLGWTYRYDYPDEALTVLAVSDERGIRSYRDLLSIGQAVDGPDFEVQHGDDGTAILADIADAYVVYVARIDEPTRWPPLFVETLACRLALDVAPVIAAELGLKLGPNLLQQYEYAKAKAQTHDFNESSEVLYRSFSPTMASRGGY